MTTAETVECAFCDAWGIVSDGVSKCLHCDGTGHVEAPKKTRVFSDNPGSCIEPGGMELDNEYYPVDCPCCGKEARAHFWQQVEGGSINNYRNYSCDHCETSGDLDD